MADVDRLMDEYVKAHRAGSDPDPAEFLGRVDGIDRLELEALIDAYLARAPRRAWDPAAFAASPAAALVARVEQALAGEPESWPALLPRWRNEAKVKRSELVTRLAAALGASAKEPKVARYYHGMEQGTLPPAGVSDRVIDALAGILGRPAGAIREAGERLAGGPGATGQEAVFARTASVDPAFSDLTAPAPARAGAPEDWDEVDELFRGG